jgi:starch synthase
MARAIVATTIGGIPEVVEDGITGLLIPPRDPESLAGKVEMLLDDPALRSRLGQAAHDEIEKQHSLDAMGERLLALYGSL